MWELASESEKSEADEWKSLLLFSSVHHQHDNDNDNEHDDDYWQCSDECDIHIYKTKTHSKLHTPHTLISYSLWVNIEFLTNKIRQLK